MRIILVLFIFLLSVVASCLSSQSEEDREIPLATLFIVHKNNHFQ